MIKQPKKEKQKGSKRSNKSQMFYNDIRWKRLRNWYMREHPLCEECFKKGISTPSTDCHHIKPFLRGKTVEDKWNLLLDEDNLIALCEECHHDIHVRLNEETNKDTKKSWYRQVGKD